MPKKQKDVKASPETDETDKFVEGEAVPAQVIEVIGRVGTRGEATQVRCKILQSMDKGKILRRNVRGPIRIDDILMLVETELEAAPLRGGRRQ
ncbi:MAG: 30S ribosomal protein S28e [Candidatus Nanoarchaeia archaeon]|jgi:small subunit ribosomal protein S28e